MDKKQVAANLASLLRDLADAVEKVANGDEAAKTFLAAHRDNYWHALVVGNSRDCDLDVLLSNEE